jgi:hypothetical protein
VRDNKLGLTHSNDEKYEINGLNQLLSEGDKSYTYDKNGNPIVVGESLLS